MALAPPVSKDGFHFADNNLYAEASGHNRHRRATLLELQELFHPKSSPAAPKDKPGHWYEAQLIHYGLPPSKTKAVAKTRLLDAVNKGGLTIPKRIQKLESELKKDWTKKEREAKSTLKKETSNVALMKKRKLTADDGNDMKASKISKTDTVKTVKTVTAKPKIKAKSDTAAVKTKKVSTAVANTVQKAAKKQTARRGGLSAGPSRGKLTSVGPETPRPKQTARSGTGPLCATSRGALSNVVSEPPRTKQTARRGGAVASTGRGMVLTSSGRPRQTARRGSGWARAPGRAATAKSTLSSEYEVHTALSEGPWNTSSGEEDINDEEDSVDEPNDSSQDKDDETLDAEDDSSPPPERAIGRLGLINGTYEIQCDDLDKWSEYDADNFTLILALEGNKLWGAYEFGMYSGIMKMDRPYKASEDSIDFSWRGQENSEGEMSYADDNFGWIRFLGDGNIEGMIGCYGQAMFSGTRVSGAETKPERSASSMMDDWAEYHEEQYERERVDRWGGSSW
jgi:hypothetical protein